ncbi:uncharacterized protein SETTUDRAFT_39720 [Exserohilum turcica Et28A]|uniref:Uncharacterized protein n=1 Tax=Exserohilum turcicum (strain 28A) TaxID=671987 RepID=R0IN81_EXST2|nr:uncharacterized protein SETTUDRAFT_39720 [Exserohilum turcica Et28A]EOA86231.1 hypothetical protein SETTUDRAFT_39720 [Exserohilum turcica Et28A]
MRACARSPECGFRRGYSYNHLYSGCSDNYGGDAQDCRSRGVARAEREAYIRALNARQSRLDSGPSFQSPFSAYTECHPVMSSPQYGFPTQSGIALGMGFMASRVGIMGMRPFRDRTTNMGLDMSGDRQGPSRPSFFTSAPTDSRNPAFNLATSRRRHSDLSSRRCCSQRPWLHSQRRPFVGQLFGDDDEDNESDFNMSWGFKPSRQRREGFHHPGQAYRAPERSRWGYNFQDPCDYNDDDDDDDDDDENDFDDFYLMNERQFRY